MKEFFVEIFKSVKSILKNVIDEIYTIVRQY